MNARFVPADYSVTAADIKAQVRNEMYITEPARARMDRAAAPVESPVAAMVRELEQAAARFALRRDNFAFGKSDTCLDIAAKLERFGSFASEKQEEFARKLVAWSLPRQPVQSVQTPEQQADDRKAQPTAQAAVLTLPKLFDLMQRLSKLHIGKLTIARKNQDSLCWIKHEDSERVIGKIEGGKLVLWQRPMIDMAAVTQAILAIEADPEGQAALHGKLSGRCSVCNRDLTDPESIAIGIGPVCLGKF